MNKDNAHLYKPFVDALAEGKTIQVNVGTRLYENWHDESDLGFSLGPQAYRIKPEPEWTLSRHIPGFRPLADSEEWHRNDGWEKRLEPGMRPLLLGEQVSVGDMAGTGQKLVKLTGLLGGSLQHDGWWYCTRRPLPPLKVKVPLEAGDVPAGSCISFDGGKMWCVVQFTNGGEVGIIRPWGGLAVQAYSFAKLRSEKATILRPGSTEWEPCEKEISQ